MRALAILCLLCVALAQRSFARERKDWAVLVAGSSGYFNYRHQADLCHAYHILHAHGIPDERIIVFMADDIAHNSDNPTPGVIINKPNGPNVYPGVPKDYTGEDVQPENFVNVITGRKAAMSGVGSGKVLESGPDDHVFINFVDHGAPGFLAFPNSLLGAKNLSLALRTMHEKRMYKQLVFYVEACESGSMFAGDLLPNNISVYATTAASGEESSYACYYDKLRQTFLGDVYSVKWMENTDEVGMFETLSKQYNVVKQEVNTSHVQKFGDFSFTEEEIGEFLTKASGSQVEESMIRLTYQPADKHAERDVVPSPDVPLATLYHRLQDAATEDAKSAARKALADELLHRNKITSVMKAIVAKASSDNAATQDVLAGKKQPTNFDCVEPVVSAFSKACFNPARVEYAMRQIYALVNMCESKSFTTARILAAIASVCPL